jgi:hypothetical protein
MAVLKAGGLERYEKKQQEKRRKYGVDKAGRQQAAADQAWHDLTHDNGQPTLDEKKLKAFPAIYEAALKEFEPRYLQLVRVHVGWLTSVQLANWMEGVHDDADSPAGRPDRRMTRTRIGPRYPQCPPPHYPSDVSPLTTSEWRQ